MKKSLIALAVLAASGAAMAQSSVTLYGVADAGVTFVDGASNWTGLTSGNQLTSRIGFRGTEDLGGGLKANFVLEAGLNLDNGDGNVSYSAPGDGDSFAFKRRSTVGLEGGFGEVRLGRELTAAYNAVARYDVFGSVGLGASALWGVVLCFTPTDPVKELFWSAVINGVVAVPIMAVLMSMATNPKVMGPHVIGRRVRWLGWAATALMGVTVLGMFVP